MSKAKQLPPVCSGSTVVDEVVVEAVEDLIEFVQTTPTRFALYLDNHGGTTRVQRTRRKDKWVDATVAFDEATAGCELHLMKLLLRGIGSTKGCY